MKYLKSNLRSQIAILIAILLVITVSIAWPKTIGKTQGKRCQLLNTQYPFLQSAFYWLDKDEVMFDVSLGLAEGDLSGNKIERHILKLSTGLLRRANGETPFLNRIDAAELQKLDNVLPNTPNKRDLIIVSPTESKLIFPRLVNGQTKFWFRDLTSNVDYDLDVNFRGVNRYAPPDIFWSDNEQIFVFQVENGALPIVLVRLNNKTIERTILTSQSPWNKIAPLYDYLMVSGMSASGRYLLVQPSTIHLSWLYDNTTGQLTTLPFGIGGNGQVAWSSEVMFFALANDGVIRYNVQTQRMDVIVPRAELTEASIDMDASLSPDGKFLIATNAEKDAHIVGGIFVCNLQ